jgi:hypothetical protein
MWKSYKKRQLASLRSAAISGTRGLPSVVSIYIPGTTGPMGLLTDLSKVAYTRMRFRAKNIIILMYV